MDPGNGRPHVNGSCSLKAARKTCVQSLRTLSAERAPIVGALPARPRSSPGGRTDDVTVVEVDQGLLDAVRQDALGERDNERFLQNDPRAWRLAIAELLDGLRSELSGVNADLRGERTEVVSPSRVGTDASGVVRRASGTRNAATSRQAVVRQLAEADDQAGKARPCRVGRSARSSEGASVRGAGLAAPDGTRTSGG